MSNKVTLTGHFTLLDGTPAEGIALIQPSRSPILDLAGKQVIAGPQRFTLDAEGRFSVGLPPTDDPALGEPFTYDVMVTMDHTNWRVTGLTLPSDMISVDVLDPPAGVVKEYPTRAEWGALTKAAVAEMESALAGAESARDTTIEARDITVVARDETLTARTETLTARDETLPARDETLAARDETLPARDETLVARDVTVEARGETFVARDVTVEARDETLTALTSALAEKVTGQGMTLRYDTTVGERILLDHPGGSTMLYGDTGWRDVHHLLADGRWSGTVRMRREGSTVSVVFDLTANVVVPLNSSLFNGTIPVGFRATYAGPYGIAINTQGLSTPIVLFSNGLRGSLNIYMSELQPGGTIRGQASWTTSQTWTDAQPGTPA